MAKAKSTNTDEKDKEPSSNEVLGSLLDQQEDGDHFNDIVPQNRIISTGSLLLDSYVRIRSGSVVRFAGKGAGLGKTSETLVLMANYMQVMPKSKGLFIKAEARLSEEMKQRSGLKFVTKPEDWTYGTVFIYSGNKFERVAFMLETLLKDMHDKGEYLCAAIDSLDGLILANDAEKEVWGGKDSPKVAGVPLLTKLLFRRIALPIVHYDALLVITSQYSAPISLNPYEPTGPRQVSGGGGSSIMHQADYVFEMGTRYNGDNILEDDTAKPDPIKNKIIGTWATYDIKKSATESEGTKIRIPIKRGRIGCAIWVEKEVVDMALQYEFVKRPSPSSGFVWHETLVKEAKENGIELREKIRGLTALYEYIEQDKDVFNFLLTKFKKMLSGE